MPEFLNRIFSKFSGDDDAYYDDYEEAADYAEEPEAPAMETIVDSERVRRDSKVVNFRGGGAQQLIVLKPSNIEMAKDIVNHLRAGRTVICNFERVDQPVAQRIVDFIYGAAHALDGAVQQISDLIFVIVPRTVAFLDGREVHDDSMDYLRQVSYSR